VEVLGYLLAAVISPPHPRALLVDATVILAVMSMETAALMFLKTQDVLAPVVSPLHGV